MIVSPDGPQDRPWPATVADSGAFSAYGCPNQALPNQMSTPNATARANTICKINLTRFVADFCAKPFGLEEQQVALVHRRCGGRPCRTASASSAASAAVPARCRPQTCRERCKPAIALTPFENTGQAMQIIGLPMPAPTPSSSVRLMGRRGDREPGLGLTPYSVEQADLIRGMARRRDQSVGRP